MRLVRPAGLGAAEGGEGGQRGEKAYRAGDEHEPDVVVVGSGAEGCRKPDPRFYERVLERVGVTVGEALFIGNDPELDILPACAAGWTTIHFDPRRQHPSADAYDVPTLRRLLLPRVGLPVPGS